ncbi:putative ubiquitin conjugating enzyme [Pseudovirgaria hyperparasitica]|uniref:E2 ubiquitin-conjugating enzyme n=1 Tax=Pseudovirgaria hyperparasitica TaxID=470096 RepID=A0A6A6WJ57_9PEZI|nr:putative ubiquitin conjugating enzyme [Pseudovirgaria hyperparasitica]KAF2761311.1 putative ubiquitin conjugating enzyme [Pseudovirgaria hyperparasitica]
MSGKKRIVKELGEITSSPPDGMRVRLVDESDVHIWEIFMDGPEQSVYSGGTFRLVLTLPKDYPFKPPILAFQTKIYHPNVSNDDKGSMCLGMLRSDEWKPPNKILAVLNMARNLLVEPNPDDAVETGIAEQYKSNRKEFEKTAKDWTKKYANAKK